MSGTPTKRPRTEPTSPARSSSKELKLAPLFRKSIQNEYRWLPTLKHTKLGKGCEHFVWGEPRGRAKIAAFDIDGTIISTASGDKFPKTAEDWRPWSPEVLPKLRQAYSDGYGIVLISNQAGSPAQQKKFKDKMPLLCRKIDVPLHVFAAFDYDIHRKPGTGMWDAFVADHNDNVAVDLASSFYVGDAAGRAGTSPDHSDCDRKLAMNIGIPFLTPEEYFKGHPPSTNWSLSGFNASTYDHDQPLYTPTSTPLLPRRLSEFDDHVHPEVIIFVGSPGAGKTSFYKKHFAPKGYVHINQDTLHTREACLSRLVKTLSVPDPPSCIIDNTSPSRHVRELYVSTVRRQFSELKVKVRCFVFTASRDVCMHNSVYRALYDRVDRGNGKVREMLPPIAFDSFRNNYEEPTLDEGFDEIKHIAFKFDGTADQLAQWQRWLVDCYKKPSQPKRVASAKASGGNKTTTR
ncbi:hypothetical protein JCM10212_003201 [Sporobolomyces blumeae]